MNRIKLSLLIGFGLTCVLPFSSKASSINAYGTITANQTWSDTVKITSDIIVQDNVTLTVAPGAKVISQGQYKINIYGRLLARGTATDTILFTSSDTTHGWFGISFDNTTGSLSDNDSSFISFCRIEHGHKNYSDGNGGGFLASGFSKIRIDKSTFANNYCYQYGAAIWGTGFVVDNCSFENNSGYGGPVVYGGGLRISNCRFLNSPITAVSNNYGTISNCTFFNNKSVWSNGALDGYNDTILKCVFNSNHADGSAGAVFIRGESVIDSCTFAGNKAGQNGGAIQIYDGSTKITRCTFSNDSSIKGGAVFIDSEATVTIDSCMFTGNWSDSGGSAVCCFSASTVQNSQFTNNSTKYWGGAILNEFGKPKLINNIYSGNSAVIAGAIACLSDAVISRSVFKKNSASANGGAIYVTGCAPSIDNCLIYKNTAATVGGGIMYNAGDLAPKITNCTITSNYGGGIYSVSENPVITNSIIWGNSSGIYVSSGSRPVISYCDIQPLTGISGFTCDTSNILSVDPLFTDTIMGDYTLKSTSTLINAGKPDTAGLGLGVFDLAGNKRDFGSAVDIGAYEYMPPIKIVSSLLPSGTNSAMMVTYTHLSSMNIRFKIKSSGDYGINLYSCSGKLVRKIGLGFQAEGIHDMNLSTNGLAPGYYYLVLNTKGQKPIVSISVRL